MTSFLILFGSTDATAKYTPWITNDAVIAGILMAMLGFVFWSSSQSHAGWKTLYKWAPMLLMCYFLRSLLTAFRVVDPLE